MADNWDDSDDEWDVDSDEDLDARLGLTKPKEEEEEIDLTVVERSQAAKNETKVLKTKGKALAEKKRKEEEQKEAELIARKAMELELERENKMTPEERKLRDKEREEEAAKEQINDLFGGVDEVKKLKVVAASAGDTVVLKDLKDHLKHARKVSRAMKTHGKIHLTSAFLKECIQESKDVLDDDAVTDLIKTLNVIKNEKVAAAKRKVKGQAQKSAKRDKAAEAKAKKIVEETFGESNKYDQYDDYADQYEDDFF